MERVIAGNASIGVGPYSQAVKANGFVFVSGQLGIDPSLGKLVSGGVEAETVQALKNIQNILETAGSSWKQVVKVTLYLDDLKDYTRVNEIYRQKLGVVPPARSTIEASALPAGARVEIEAIAVM